MDNFNIQLVGGPCGQHGPYTFYKAFKYTTKNGLKRVVTLSEFFFVKLWIDSDLLCIGELQLLWSDKNSEQVLASLRLYFLPENTPEGRMDHGEDEVLAISEKVVLRVEDLISWITVDAEWTWGRLAKCEKDIKEPPENQKSDSVFLGALSENFLDFSDVDKEKNLIGCNSESIGPLVVILSYPRYCRYRAMMRRLEGVENEYLKYKIVNALGGFTACTKNTRILFCKDTFDYPELEGHELLCNHLAPKLKGRPRGKRKKRSLSPGSESNESECSISNVFKEKTVETYNNRLRVDTNTLRRSTRAIENNESKEFCKELCIFMKTNYSPIGKIPSLGYKELDLYSFYHKVQKLGGYDSVTSNRLWKSVFDDMSGHTNSTSAATVIRRHYERFLLPYERHIKCEEYKPLPVSERRRLKSKAGSTSSEQDSTSEATSRSGNTTPLPEPLTPTTPTDNKEFNIQEDKSETKRSALRNVRVKSDRSKENQNISNDPNVGIKSEPLTCAVAPLVQVPSEKIVKEEPSVIEIGDIPIVKSPEVIEVPYKSEICDIKKRKLDILKEGGLEVTPVMTKNTEIRPSVIQQIGPKTEAKKIIEINSVTPTKIVPFNNGTGPPKVVQSRSIYTYSDKMVYGDPKDIMPSVHTPKSVASKHVGDILDLTVTSPQKPLLEFMKIPPITASQNSHKSKLLEGRRLNSNLEITLVNNLPSPKYNLPSRPTPIRYPQKRLSNEQFSNQKITKIEDKFSMPSPLYPPRNLINEPHEIPAAVPSYKQMTTPAFPYLTHLYDNKVPPPYLPFLDPLSYTAAMQNFYGQAQLSAPPPPVPPLPIHEHLKLYTNIISRSSRLNYPFPIGLDGNPSLNNFKKP